MFVGYPVREQFAINKTEIIISIFGMEVVVAVNLFGEIVLLRNADKIGKRMRREIIYVPMLSKVKLKTVFKLCR